ncbi:MAG: MarR family winged helix-turn-helix transcriptional regulator [Reyranellaceae bacterium]
MDNGESGFALEKFLPYRLSVVTQTVSGGLSKIYASRFDLSVPQWRVMAVLGRYEPISANEVCERTVMDKVAVSRAVQAMLRRGLVERTVDARDRRRSALRLSKRGRAIHNEIVPLALDYERKLISAMTPEERAMLDSILRRLLHGA